ncbi:hypothetical protein [Arthrobacter sp. zg-Y769]|uniref:hypothetical protein n=1 Tax=Arthrobacter sp. zg-Y769 TaxID=2894191 RepID=UPI001E5232E2|nr:hypothetical protein [Arthrobacter sp. zg-Y769]MCC9205452.1 hypothetical protein [Arthrobacter sp. zg-Y769]
MSRKTQQGAAERSDAVPGTRPGPVTRLRAQPGFRAAAVVFVLTVVLGAGGPAAYAFWSQSTAVTITGSTVPPLTPVPTGASCVNGWLTGRIVLPAMRTADPEARYILTFTSKRLNAPMSYALPQSIGSDGSVQPIEIGGLVAALGSTEGQKVAVNVTVKTAILKSPRDTVTRVTAGDLLFPSSEAAPLAMNYSTTERYEVPSMFCAR